MNKQLAVPGGGEFVDADWSPHDQMFMVATIQRPHRLVIYDAPDRAALLPLAWLTLGRWGLWTRLGVDDGGWGCVVMQDGRDAKPDGTFWPAIVCIFNGTDKIFEVQGAPPAFGEQGIEVVGIEEGWFVFIQTSPTMWWRGMLRRDGTWRQQIGFPMPAGLPEGTSQGFSDGNRDGTVRFRDQWRTHYAGLVWPSEDRSLVVGQNADDGPDRIRGLYDGSPFVVYRGAAFEPHVVRGNSGWLVVARTPEGPAAVLTAPPYEVEAPPAPPPPPPPSAPHSDPKEPTVQIPNLSRVVHGVSGEHPHLLAENSRESMTELLWRVADELHRFHDERFGLLSKSEGENHTEIGGIMVAVDALAYQGSDQVVDIFANAYDGRGTGGLTWGPDERRPSNKWVKPPLFAGGGRVPADDPADDPEPKPEPEITLVDLRPVVAVLTTISEHLVHIGTRIDSIEAILAGKADQVVGKIDELQRDVQAARAVADAIRADVADGVKVLLR
jgi:hypothetical protein